MLSHGELALSEAVKTGNPGWRCNLTLNRETIAVIEGANRGSYITIRWKKYSMTSDVLKRVSDIVSKIDGDTGEMEE